MEIDKVSTTGRIAINNTVDKETKDKPLKEQLNDSSWAGIIRNWIVGLVVITWGGQGICDRNFNNKPDNSTEINKLREENLKLQERIEKLEKKFIFSNTERGKI